MNNKELFVEYSGNTYICTHTIEHHVVEDKVEGETGVYGGVHSTVQGYTAQCRGTQHGEGTRASTWKGLCLGH